MSTILTSKLFQSKTVNVSEQSFHLESGTLTAKKLLFFENQEWHITFHQTENIFPIQWNSKKWKYIEVTNDDGHEIGPGQDKYINSCCFKILCSDNFKLTFKVNNFTYIIQFNHFADQLDLYYDIEFNTDHTFQTQSNAYASEFISENSEFISENLFKFIINNEFIDMKTEYYDVLFNIDNTIIQFKNKIYVNVNINLNNFVLIYTKRSLIDTLDIYKKLEIKIDHFILDNKFYDHLPSLNKLPNTQICIQGKGSLLNANLVLTFKILNIQNEEIYSTSQKWEQVKNEFNIPLSFITCSESQKDFFKEKNIENLVVGVEALEYCINANIVNIFNELKFVFEIEDTTNGFFEKTEKKYFLGFSFSSSLVWPHMVLNMEIDIFKHLWGLFPLSFSARHETMATLAFQKDKNMSAPSINFENFNVSSEGIVSFDENRICVNNVVLLQRHQVNNKVEHVSLVVPQSPVFEQYIIIEDAIVCLNEIFSDKIENTFENELNSEEILIAKFSYTKIHYNTEKALINVKNTQFKNMQENTLVNISKIILDDENICVYSKDLFCHQEVDIVALIETPNIFNNSQNCEFHCVLKFYVFKIEASPNALIGPLGNDTGDPSIYRFVQEHREFQHMKFGKIVSIQANDFWQLYLTFDNEDMLEFNPFDLLKIVIISNNDFYHIENNARSKCYLFSGYGLSNFMILWTMNPEVGNLCPLRKSNFKLKKLNFNLQCESILQEYQILPNFISFESKRIAYEELQQIGWRSHKNSTQNSVNLIPFVHVNQTNRFVYFTCHLDFVYNFEFTVHENNSVYCLARNMTLRRALNYTQNLSTIGDYFMNNVSISVEESLPENNEEQINYFAFCVKTKRKNHLSWTKNKVPLPTMWNLI
jgi:hypothetical protein